MYIQVSISVTQNKTFTKIQHMLITKNLEAAEIFYLKLIKAIHCNPTMKFSPTIGKEKSVCIFHTPVQYSA